jgi:hypothetical protein
MLARPKKVVFVTALPRTRSGKVLRRIIQNVIADENFKDLKLVELQAVIDDLATAIRTQNAAGEFAAA